ncbi:MAG: phosphomannomutase/phosphoglucomutase [Kiritimatiellae bacterium]|nr:phosphomannomutase/phosphoglucomutase [Kiritimatiellia bacterium]
MGGFFKAYDMRGTFGTDFDLGTVRRVGAALPKVVGGPRWLVGRDARTSSPSVHAALIDGLRSSGADVTDLGLCTTPMVYFFTAEDGFDGSVMITASHNPPSDNGLKVSKRTALPVGYADGLDEVERLVSAPDAQAADGPMPAPSAADAPDPQALSRYIAWQRKAVDDSVFKSLRYAVDCSNGVSSILAHELFPGAEFLNDTVDGRFPCHSPNPLKAEAREQAAQLVREKGLDFAVIFDGDADRCMFVDGRGEFVQPDYLIPVIARATLAAMKPSPGAKPKVIHDVRTSRGAIETLREMGCEPVMVPVGHAFAKPALRECGALCGGELAGHYYFSEFFGCDSGVLAARRIISEIARAKASGVSFGAMMASVSGRYANSGELNFKVEDKDSAIERVLACAAKSLPKELSRSAMDGLRIEYAEGWINVRKSNTEPYLRLIAECDTPDRLNDWVALLGAAIEG